ncbi:MAG: YihY/virulence factor BrkB family protein [Clostridia bacterium]|nr:YihY/virulence factor BrkB family protein [Clostridia bacterium]
MLKAFWERFEKKYEKPIGVIRQLIQLITDDLITVYAAQASFFVIISIVPFFSLLIAIVGLVIPADILSLFDGSKLPPSLMSFVSSTLTDLRNAPNVSLLSISAVITLWISSKGTAAILTGISRVYHAPPAKNMVSHKLKSLASTLVMIGLILAAVALLLFGDLLVDVGIKMMLLPPDASSVFELRIPVLLAIMCAIFTAIYTYTARRSAYVKKSIFAHMPGAVFASLGWMIFSMLFSLYITHFPDASYVYGSLGAICLMMLWLYICMIILLLGAEVNKIVHLLIVHHKLQKKVKAKMNGTNS